MKGRIGGCPVKGIPWGPADGNEMKGTDTEFVLGERARGRWKAGGRTGALEEPGSGSWGPGL